MKHVTSVLVKFAVETIHVTLLMQVAPVDHVDRGEPMRAGTSNDEPLLEQRRGVEPVLDPFRKAIDRRLDRAVEKHLAERVARRVEKLDLHARMAVAETPKEVGEHARADGAHH